MANLVPGQEIDIGKYSEQKKLGLAMFVKLNGQPHYSFREYDRTGKPVVINAAVNRDGLVEVIAQQEKQIEIIKAVIASAQEALADMDAAPEVIPQA